MLLGVVVVTFLLLRLIPGDPARTLLSIHATDAQVAALRHQLGLDQPIWRQFWHYLDGLLHGNLGTSIYYTKTPVASVLAPGIPLTAALVLVATIFAVVITVPLAALAATRQERAADHAVRLFSVIGLGMPSFWLGVILSIWFSLDLHWFPVGGYGTGFWQHLHSLILPGFCAAFAIVPVLIRSLPRRHARGARGRLRGDGARQGPAQLACHLRARGPQRPRSRPSTCSGSTSPTSSAAPS